MNTQSPQSLKNCIQSEAYELIDSKIDRMVFQVQCVVSNMQQYLATRKLASNLSKMTEGQLKDIGFDDPQTQMSQLRTNFNAVKSVSEININRYLFR